LKEISSALPDMSVRTGLAQAVALTKWFASNLNLDKLKIPATEQVRVSRFETVGESERTELVTKKVTIKEFITTVKKDMAIYRPHIYSDRWTKRAIKLKRANLLPEEALGTCDYMAGLNFCSIQTVTCAPDNHGYCEVFIVQRNMRLVGGEGDYIFTTLGFFFFGKSTSEFTDNDIAAHDVHEAEVLHILRDEHGITNNIQVSDGCAKQYFNRRHISNVAFLKKKNGLDMSHLFTELFCGKGPHDSAEKVVTSRILKAVFSVGYVPDAFMGYEVCRVAVPYRGELYAQMEKDENPNLPKIKWE
jgi:hypothetical protein